VWSRGSPFVSRTFRFEWEESSVQTRTEPVQWPAGPAGHVLFGNLPEIWHNWLDALTRHAREYGDFAPIRLGPTQAVLLNDPAYVEDVLVTHNRAFINSCALRKSGRIFDDGLHE
jgi:hypothetical protein